VGGIAYFLWIGSQRSGQGWNGQRPQAPFRARSPWRRERTDTLGS